ncbi:MAG: ROK family transcriptional regulator [Anaerolineae bacterium]|jgi:glucokinase-like ROK family protein
MSKRKEPALAPNLMRELNKSLVLKVIREERPISRAEIAKRTRLSRSTVSAIVDKLLESEFIREQGVGKSRGGRRPILLDFNPRAGFVVGLDIGAAHLLAVVADLQATLLVTLEEPFSIEVGPEKGLAQAVQIVETALEKANVLRPRVLGVGVAVPGPVDYAAGMVVSPPIMPGWDRVPIRDRLQGTLGLPVYLDNDANLGALGEYAYGAGKNVSNLAYIKIGTGIGCGLIVDGRIYRGQRGYAGEIGHLTIDENGPPCRCGSFGCLESMASAEAIVRRAEMAMQAGQQTSLSQHRRLTATDIARAARERDALSQQLFEEAGRHIGVALAGLINLFNPGRVIIGVGADETSELLLDPVQRTVGARAMAGSLADTRIVPAQLRRETVAAGAVALVLEQTFRNPVTALTQGNWSDLHGEGVMRKETNTPVLGR